jgi:hypothetical protein
MKRRCGWRAPTTIYCRATRDRRFSKRASPLTYPFALVDDKRRICREIPRPEKSDRTWRAESDRAGTRARTYGDGPSPRRRVREGSTASARKRRRARAAGYGEGHRSRRRRWDESGGYAVSRDVYRLPHLAAATRSDLGRRCDGCDTGRYTAANTRTVDARKSATDASARCSRSSAGVHGGVRGWCSFAAPAAPAALAASGQ